MLGGKNLSWSHECGLVAVFDGDEGGLHRNDRFAGAYVALQEAAHGLGLAHVADDLAEDAFLRDGGVEGQDLLDRFADLQTGGEDSSGAFAHATAFEFEAEFEVEEFFEDQAAMADRLSAQADQSSDNAPTNLAISSSE